MKKLFLNLTKISVCFICICLLGIITTEASKYELGDVKRDGLVNASDALLVLRNSAKLEEFDDYQKIVADVNKDDQINSEDALQVLNVAADIDIFRIEVELAVGQEYVIDKIYDAGAYMWLYDVNTNSGITVEKSVEDLPSDSAPGDTPEQIFTITAKETGTYEIYFKLCQPWDENQKNAEERIYIINVKEDSKPTPETPDIVKVRVTGTDGISSYPMAQLISTYDDYITYAQKLKESILYYYDIDKVDVYGEEFFENNNLLVVSLEEISGSHRIQFNEIIEDENGKCVICIDRFHSEFETEDMVFWKMLIPIEGKDWTDKEFEVSITDHHWYDYDIEER